MSRAAFVGVVLLMFGVGVLPGQGPRIVRSAHFELTIQGREDPTRVADALERAYTAVESRSLRLPSSVRARAYNSTTEFGRASGTSRNHLAAYRSGTLHLQPVSVLVRRGWFERTFRHELVHLALERATSRGLPRWLNEGLASHVAGEHYRIPSRRYSDVAELERALATESRPEAIRAAYATAERLAARLVSRHGWPAVVSVIRLTEVGGDFALHFSGLVGVAPDTWARRELRTRLTGR